MIFDSLKLLRSQAEVPDGDYVLEFGKARVLRDGTDMTLLGIGATTALCLQAAAGLEQAGISAEVVDLLTLSPWDVPTVTESVRKTGRLVVTDFDHPSCGLATEICARVTTTAWDRLLAAPVTVTPPPVPAMGMDASAAMAAMYLPDSAGVAAAATKIAGTGSRR